MSEMSVARPVRKIAVADHIWGAFETMALEMGSDRDGLINQALFMFARLNGYLSTGTARSPGAPASASDVLRLSAVEAPLPEEQTPLPAQPLGRRPIANPPLGRPPGREPRIDPEPLSLRARAADVDPEPRWRVGETPGRAPPVMLDSESGRSSNDGEFDAPPQPRGMDNDPDRMAVAERVLETAAELERLIKGKAQPPAQGEFPPVRDGAPDLTPEPAAVAEKGLYLVFGENELDRIAKDRFLIGRGKHCDLVINSGKVSREHAAIVRENGEYYIEDLGSSNGTWFSKQRIKRRKIEDGDEYFICSDKVKCVLR